MPRKKVVEIAPPESGDTAQPPGEALPPLEDFVRKMSNVFSENIVIPEMTQVPGDDEDSEEDEDDDEESDS